MREMRPRKPVSYRQTLRRPRANPSSQLSLDLLNSVGNEDKGLKKKRANMAPSKEGRRGRPRKRARTPTPASSDSDDDSPESEQPPSQRKRRPRPPETNPISATTRLKRPQPNVRTRTKAIRNPNDDLFAIEMTPESKLEKAVAATQKRKRLRAYEDHHQSGGESESESDNTAGVGEEGKDGEESEHAPQEAPAEVEDKEPHGNEEGGDGDVSGDAPMPTQDNPGSQNQDQLPTYVYENDSGIADGNSSDHINRGNGATAQSDREGQGENHQTATENLPPENLKPGEQQMGDPSLLQLPDVFWPQETWCELIHEATELHKQANDDRLTPLSQRLLKIIKKARNAYEAKEEPCDSLPDYCSNIARKVSSVLSDIAPMPEAQFYRMAPNRRFEWETRISSKITGIQTQIIPNMAEVIPAAVDAFQSLPEQVGLQIVTQLLKSTCLLCEKVKPSFYPTLTEKFPDRLKTIRVAARFLHYLFDTQLSKLRAKPPEKRPVHGNRDTDTAPSCAPASPPATSPSRPAASRPDPSSDHHTEPELEPKPDPELEPELEPEPEPVEPEPEPEPEPQSEREWTDREGTVLIDGLRKYQGTY